MFIYVQSLSLLVVINMFAANWATSENATLCKMVMAFQLPCIDCNDSFLFVAPHKKSNWKTISNSENIQFFFFEFYQFFCLLECIRLFHVTQSALENPKKLTFLFPVSHHRWFGFNLFERICRVHFTPRSHKMTRWKRNQSCHLKGIVIDLCVAFFSTAITRLFIASLRLWWWISNETW